MSHGLVVEDDPDQAHAIVRLLGARGIRAREARTSEEAMAMLVPAPDLIVVDVPRVEDATVVCGDRGLGVDDAGMPVSDEV